MHDHFNEYFSVILFIVAIVACLLWYNHKINLNKMQQQYEAGYIAGYNDAINGEDSKFDY